MASCQIASPRSSADSRSMPPFLEAGQLSLQGTVDVSYNNGRAQSGRTLKFLQNAMREAHKANRRPPLDCRPSECGESIMINLFNIAVMQTFGLTATVFFGLVAAAGAAGVVPEEYQGVWAAARDCKGNFQNVLANVVDREFAACRVIQVLNSDHAERRTSIIYLNCGGSQNREIWSEENIEGTDYLVIIRFEQGAETGAPSIDMYKRCPEIPLGEIPLGDIPGNPVDDMASEETVAPTTRAQIPRQRPSANPRATHIRKYGHQ